MESSEFKMILPVSLSGRIVTKVVQETNKLKSSVYLVKNDRTVNLKSILGILSSNCCAGDVVTVMCLNNDKSVAEQDRLYVEKLLNSGDF